MVNKLLMGAVFLAVGIWLISTFVVGVSPLASLAVSGSALLLLLALTNMVPQLKQFNAFPLNKNIALIVGIIGVAGILTGGTIFSQIGVPVPGAIATVPGQVAQVGVAPGECDVSDFQKGDSATLTFNPFDVAVNPKSGTGTVPMLIIDTETNQIVDGPSNMASSSKVSVGQVLNLYPGIDNTSYYGDAMLGVCIKSEQQTLEIDLLATQTATSMSFTGKDIDGNALTTGTTNEEDYEITLGASAEEPFITKLKNNAADKAYDLCGFATAVFNDIDELKLQESGYTNPGVPTYLKTTIYVNESAGQLKNQTNYDKVWKSPTVDRLMEWEFIEHSWIIEAGTTDPTAADAASGTTAQDHGIITIADCDWASDGNGMPVYDFFKHDDTEADVGVTETVTSPLGKETGMIIEGV